MKYARLLIAVEPSPQKTEGFVVTLEGTSLFLTVLVSSFILIGGAIKLVSKFNHISAKIRDLEEDLNTHSTAEGHAKILEQFKLLQKDVCSLDKKFEIHIQDYVNYKDAVLLAINTTKELNKHTADKSKEFYRENKAEIKELQNFLQKQHEFKIRD